MAALTLDRIAFYGRSLREYRRMFDLDLARWRGAPILDCPSGPASFAAEGRALGLRVTACDPLFRHGAARLGAIGRRDIEHVAGRVLRVRSLFRWKEYRSIAGLRRARGRALERFCADYPAGRKEGRYVCGKLPELPFARGAFQLSLCGHFLFGYGNILREDFHLAAISELLRVSSREVRIFPTAQDDGRPYPGLPAILRRLRRRKVAARIVPVDFEFQKGADRMLLLRRI